MHTMGMPSPWLVRWAHLLQPGARVLDLACGSGRHVRWLAQRGHHVLGVDRDAQALTGLRGLSGVQTLEADLEGQAWPLSGQTFDLVLVTNYLWRPLLADVAACVAPGGLLLYETFALGNEAYGRPSRPDFLLRPGELLQAFSSLAVIAYEEGLVESPKRVLQRLAAHRPMDGLQPPLLQPAGPADLR